MREGKKEGARVHRMILIVILFFFFAISTEIVLAIEPCSRYEIQNPNFCNLKNRETELILKDMISGCENTDPATCFNDFASIEIISENYISIYLSSNSPVYESSTFSFSVETSSLESAQIIINFLDTNQQEICHRDIFLPYDNTPQDNGLPETCDGTDQNCDGNNDLVCECINGATQQCGTTDEGICEFGIETCSDGFWTDCTAILPAEEEDCDTDEDDNCDGIPNNGCIPTLSPCDATIVSPENNSYHLIHENIIFEAGSNQCSNYFWIFRDTISQIYPLPTGKIYYYSFLSPQDVNLTLQVNRDEFQAESSINVSIVQCTNEDTTYCHSTKPLCCDYSCRAAKCITDDDCINPITGMKGACINSDCDAYCDYEVSCTVNCSSDSECDDKDDSTTDSCENKGECSSYCLNQPFNSTILELPKNETEIENIESFLNDSIDELDQQNNESNLLSNILINDKRQELNIEQIKSILAPLFNASNFNIKRSFKVVNLTTVFSLNITSNVPIGYKDIILREMIPKDVVSSTQFISGDFNIINEDPEIEFIIQKFNSGGEVEITYVVNQVIEGHNAEKITATIIGGTPNQEELDEFLRLQQLTANETTITKKVTVEDGKTKVEQTVSPKKGLKDVDLYLSIPKCMAERLNEVYFSNKNYHIIADDPMVVWHFDEIKEDIDLKYEVFKDITDKDCQNQAVIIAVAKEIEGTILNKKSLFSTNILLALLVIPVVVFVFISIKRFIKTDSIKKVIKEDEDILQKNLKHIASYVDKESAKGMDAKQIVKNLHVVGWTEEIIKESLAEVKDENAREQMKRYFEKEK